MSQRYKEREDGIDRTEKIQLQRKIDKTENMEDATVAFENFFKEKDQLEEKPEPKLEILYDGFDNTYSIDGVPYSKIVYNKKDQRETNERLIGYLNEQFGIDLLGNVKNKKNAIKNLDPTILAILNSRRGKDACKKYIESMCELKSVVEPDKSEANFDIIYDLDGISHNKNLSFSQKLGMLKIANKSEKISKVNKDTSNIKDKKDKKITFVNKFSKIASLVVASLAAIGIAGSAHDNQKSIDKNEIKEITGQVSTKVEDIQLDLDINQKEVESSESFKDLIKIENDEVHKKSTLGDIVYLEEGCNYYEDSMQNGVHNTIDTNNQWRKAGNYMLDGLAVTYQDNEGNWKIAKSMNDETNGGNYGNLGLDAKEYVERIIQENGLSKNQVRVMYHINMGTETGKRPTGWIEAPEEGFLVESTYENQQRMQETNENIR